MESRTELDTASIDFQHNPSAFTLSDRPSCLGCSSHYSAYRPWPCAYSTIDDVLAVDEFANAFTAVVTLIEEDDDAIAIDEDLGDAYPSWVLFGLAGVGLISRTWHAWFPGEEYKAGREKIGRKLPSTW